LNPEPDATAVRGASGRGGASRMLGRMESHLGMPGGEVYIHSLTSALETAIRSSNAKFEPESVKSRLDVRLLDAHDGECGWDIFSLEYHIKNSPIEVMLYARDKRGDNKCEFYKYFSCYCMTEYFTF
tara:strand:- start:707 stop:1087 length:381 start_codon:yes stop_codon:yes gene_type:complete